jgi:uncharacterized LabA/DUF88 family protein
MMKSFVHPSSLVSDTVNATLLIDYAWVDFVSSKAGLEINLHALADRLQTELSCRFGYKAVFTAKNPRIPDSDPNQLTSDAEMNQLRRTGFDVHRFSCKLKTCSACDTESMVQPGSVDSAICMAISESFFEKRRLLVLVAGDGDFAFALNWLKRKDSTITVVLAVPTNRNERSISSELIPLVDKIIECESFGAPVVTHQRRSARVSPERSRLPVQNHSLVTGTSDSPMPSARRTTNSSSSGSESDSDGQHVNRSGNFDLETRNSFKVFVGGLSDHTDSRTLTSAMSRFGSVQQAHVIHAKNGGFYGIVKFETTESANAAASSESLTQGIAVDGKVVDIKRIRPKLSGF